MKNILGICVATMAVLCVGNAQAATLYSNNFSSDLNGWTGAVLNTPTATVSAGDYTNFGGYNFGNPSGAAFQEYYTSLDIYLDLSGTLVNDTRFDYTSAISKPNGTHHRDFAFNVGFYTGADRFVVSASNNTGRVNSNPQNPARDPLTISTSGWYTFQHHFYENSGVLAVDMSIFNASDVLLKKWTLSEPADTIAQIGGNRYGWFPNNEFAAGLQIDNALLETGAPAVVPIPGAAGLGLLGMGLVGLRRRFRKTA